jgi:UDP-N-acetylglucosamine--N-acetylmuramyl-(pentapeptide) pyrophosphoryl-undecaprenol N-acetylglucosamine transferase
MEDKKRILIAGGGTGGHFYPGFALAHEMRNRGWQVLFLTKRNDPAQKQIEESDFTFAEASTVGFSRSLNVFRHFVFAHKLISSLFETSKILSDYAPDIVVGMGGYVSFSAAVEAKFKGIPLLLHDSNAKIGLATRMALKFGGTLATGLPAVNAGQNAKLVGTPIRAEFGDEISQQEAKQKLGLPEDKKTVLIFGGSQGAKKLNQAACELVKKIRSEHRNMYFVHITGTRDYKEIENRYGQDIQNIKLIEYCNDMNVVYRASDLIVCRSGASTVSELIALKKPAILVPFPYSAEGHQVENAKVLSAKNCAKLILQTDMVENDVYRQIISLLENEKELEKMQKSYDSLNLPNPLESTKLLADMAVSLTE